jgi:hypothetical protein
MKKVDCSEAIIPEIHKKVPMRRDHLWVKTSIILIGILVLLLSRVSFSQDFKASGDKAVAAPQETAEKTISGFLRDVLFLSQPKGIKIKIMGEGLASAYHKFVLSDPARLVIDFPGSLSTFPKKFIDMSHSLLKEIRIGQHPDKVRLVFIFPGADIPLYHLVKENDGLTLWIGEMEKESEEARKPAEEEKRGLPGIKPSEEKKQALPDPRGEAEKLSAKPQLGNRISLDFKDADIRGIFRLISKAAQIEIIPSEEVQGTITLRLFDVPWEQALEAILSIYNLKKIEEGNLIRILPKGKT